MSGTYLNEKTFQPVANKILLKVIKETETKGGIQLPDRAQVGTYQTPQGLVVCVGPDCKYVKPGDRVMAPGSLGATKTFFRGDEFITICELDLLGRFLVDPDRE